MPYEFRIDRPPVGYALTPSGPRDRTVTVAATEFTSTEDGQHFIQRLEGFPNEILSSIAKNGPHISPSTVDHLLAVIQHDGTNTIVTAYVNELELSTLIRVGRAIQTGEPVFRNDIVDIHSFRVEGVGLRKSG